MHNFTRSLIIALIYNILFALPVVWLKYLYKVPITVSLFCELTIPILLCWLLFYLVLFLGMIGELLISCFFVVGAVVSYYIFAFGKGLDIGVVIDALSIEQMLIRELINTYVFSLIVCAFIVGVLIARKTKGCNIKIASCFLMLLLAISAFSGEFNVKKLRVTTVSYQPFGLFYGIYSFYKIYLPQIQSQKNKINLATEYEFEYSSKDKKPVVIVFVIGESMRGSLIGLNGYEVDNTPLLAMQPHLISFTNASSSETITRLSLPYMLTRAAAPDWQRATSEKGIISIFNSIGFNTSWIGNQGLFGAYETTFASNALEANMVVTNLDLRNISGKIETYDEALLPYIKQTIENSPNDNHFIVMHMLGSHWAFSKRYPETFGSKFTPVCTNAVPSECLKQEILNSYFSSIAYSDYVLDNLLKYLSDKNALVFFSSDHGVSLGENGIYAQGATGDNVPKEQHDIAMFMWVSDEFLRGHTDEFTKVKLHKDRPVSHDNIFHTILDCSGVKSLVIDKGLSLCR